MVALSSTEAEYIAACNATQELMWLNKIIVDMNVPESLPVKLFEDNQGCISMSKNAETKRTKHIDVKWYYLRDCVNNGKISLTYIPTNDQIADLLTKPLGKEKHRMFTGLIGLKRGGVLMDDPITDEE